MKLLLALCFAMGLAACTPGADHSATSSPTSPGSTVTIDVNLTLDAPSSVQQGQAGGYRPVVTTVPLGAAIRFVNSDGFAHTATSIGVPASFPGPSPFGTSALAQTGTMLSLAWSSGVLQAGGSSQTLIADQRGTYLYGCFFHYGAPMRAVIVVQ